MADQNPLSLVSDPFAPAPGPRPGEIGTPAPASRVSSLISDPRESARLEDAARRAQTTTPDQAARVLRLERRTGLPAELIARNLDEVERQAAAADFDVEHFRATSPLLARWLAEHPDRLALTNDDLRPLSSMERAIGVGRNVVGAAAAGVMGFSQGIWGAIQAGAEIPTTTATPSRLIGQVPAASTGPIVAGTIDLYAQPKVRNADGSISTVDSFSVEIDGQEVLLPTVTPDGRHLSQADAIAEYEKTGRHLGIFRTPEAATAYAQQLHEDYAAGAYDRRPVSARVAAFAAGTAAVAQHLAERARGPQTGAGFVERAIYSGVESVGQNVPGLLLGVATGGAAGEASLLASMGITTGGQSYAQARAEGVTPGTARVFGGIQGIVEVATEMLPVHLLLKDLAGHASLITTLAHQAVSEVPGEEIATVLQDLNEWAFLPENKDRTFMDYLRDRPSAAAATAIATITAVGATTVIAHGSSRVLEQLGAAAHDSATIARAPAEVRSLIDSLTADSPLAAVHVPIDPFTEYFQGKGLNPAAIAAQLTGDPAAYARARESGADLAVPMGAYVTQIAASEHQAFFAAEARLTPDALNVREAQAIDQALGAQLEAARAVDEPAAAAPVREAVLALLDQAGIPPQTAQTYATLYEHAFQTIATRAGVDPVALFQRYGLQVQREGITPEAPAAPVAPIASEEAPTSDLPPSVARPGESPAQQTQRTRSHWAELLATVLRDARAVDPMVDVQAIREEFASRRARFDESEALARESGQHPETLLRAIADAGGLWYERNGAYKGEIEQLKESNSAPDMWANVKGVFREAGLSPDRMLETLRQDPRFAHLENINGLLDAVDAAIRRPAEPATLPGTRELASTMGIELGTRWWAPAPVVDQETAFYQSGVNSRRAQLEAQIAAARAAGREDLRAQRALQALLETDSVVTPATSTQPAAAAPLEPRFDPTHPDFLRQDERARIRFTPNRQFTIELFKRADLSSFLHESGHFYFEVLGDVADELAAQDPATLTELQRRLLADYGTVLHWLGVESRAAITTDQHEQFARAFEAYLLEGTAPSPALRSVFARVRAWLVSLYRSARRLDVEISPPIRAVMDRLLASDEAIDAAQQDQRLLPFPDAIANALGLSPAEREAYRASVQAASDQARDTLQGQLLHELQRERAAWWKDERATIRTQIAADIADQSIYRALALLQRGTQPDGSPLRAGVEPFKLSQENLVEQFGEGVLQRLPRPLVYTKRDGVPVSVAAELLGFPNATALVQALVVTPPLGDAIDSAADDEMRRRHGDLLLDGTIADAARQAVLDAGAEVFAAELKALAAAAARRPGRRPITVPPVAALRTIAERRIADTRLRDIRPETHAAAARRAGEQALAAAGRQDFTAALAAKQRQVLSAELYRAATAARQTIADAIASFKPLFGRDAALAQRYNLDLVNAARSLLASFDLAPRAQEAAASTYLEQVRRYDPELHKDLEIAIEAAAQPGRPYRELTLDEFTALRDAVANLQHLARRSRQIVIEGRARDLNDVRGELEARLQAIGLPHARRGYDRQITTWEKTKLYLMGWRASLRRVESWVDAVDSGKPDGAFRRTLFTGISEAGSAYREAKKTLLTQYLEVVKAVEPSLTPKDLAAPEINYTFSGKMELLHALLHTGNESNFSKLLRGRNWGSETPEGVLDSSRWDAFVRRAWQDGTLVKADYDYVQGVWDLLEAVKPDAQRVFHDLYGYYFAEITARAFQTPFGEYRGGYMPAIVDPFLATDAALRADQRALEQTPSTTMFPTTGRGWSKGRIEAYARPLALDLRVVPAHLDEVLRFIHLEPRVKDVARLVMHKGFRRTLDAFDPAVGGELLVPWLQRAAKQTIDTPAQGWGGRGADRFVRALRRRTGLQIMTANVLNALQQTTGLSIASLEVPQTALARALFQYVRGPGTMADAVAEKSAFMRTRTTTQTLEIQAHIDDLLLDPSTYETLRSFGQQHGYFLSSATQNIVDVITWSGAYDHATADGATEVEAVRRADAAVRLTQGDFNPEDLSAFETGSPTKRAFTMFYSYWNMLANELGSKVAIVARDLGLRAGAGRLLYIYTFGFMLPALLSELIMAVGRGELPTGDDDDGILLDYLFWFLGTQQRAATSMIPFGGQVINVALAHWAEKPKEYDERISVSPAIAAIESAARAPHSVYEAILHDGRKKTAIRDALTAVGLLTGLPVAPLGKPLGYLADVAEGQVQPTGPADVARGLVTGR